jgi:hypothetical protein
MDPDISYTKLMLSSNYYLCHSCTDGHKNSVTVLATDEHKIIQKINIFGQN